MVVLKPVRTTMANASSCASSEFQICCTVVPVAHQELHAASCMFCYAFDAFVAILD